MAVIRIILAAVCTGVFMQFAHAQESPSQFPLTLPVVGANELRVISPTMLELTLVSTKKPDPAPVTQWNFVQGEGNLKAPAATQFVVHVNGAVAPVKSVGFKRRVLYAPLRVRDLRIGNYLYLELSAPIAQGGTVEVLNPDHALWPEATKFVAKADDAGWSPAIHVNQTGYAPSWPKKAMVGYFLGSLGECDFSASGGEFTVIESATAKEVFRGKLMQRRDKGFPYPAYQEVREADFSAFKTPGEYRLRVAGVGTSYPFFIDDGMGAAFARTFALGIYHQRCGGANEFPYTRFTHGVCHAAPAEVPDLSKKFEYANYAIGGESKDAKSDPRHTAPVLKDTASSLYPYVRKGKVDVSGGHHDAGDYSKYTINSAQFVHQLVFAVDVFPGVAELDNLGLPESGDGKSDVLQEAKWEADFLAKMQDDDGGFYFLVYPRDRPYELDVFPDHGDPQVVWPKTTAVTAAGVAALAQCASSPTFKKQFPEAAAMYLEKAKKGWAFLDQAIKKYGKDGAYQRISHYGDVFIHDDELAWAACELFLATGDPSFEKKFIEWTNVGDVSTRKWGWWRLFESYGCAIRSYTFAEKAGKIKREKQQPIFLERCEAEIVTAGEEQMERAIACAYGTSFSDEAKRYRTAGWYFPGEACFDLLVAMQLDYPKFRDPRPKMFDAIIGNLNYEAGCNPVNMDYIIGLGWKRQHEIVHQYALNDERTIPQTGIPLGAAQAGFGWLELYGRELGALSYPLDGDDKAPYPIYDRWGDSFNLSTEFVAVNQARELAYLSWLMAQSSIKTQTWKFATAEITGIPANASSKSKMTVELKSAAVDLKQARIVWEARGNAPAYGTSYTFTPTNSGSTWIEAEAQLPDGRRVFATNSFPQARSK